MAAKAAAKVVAKAAAKAAVKVVAKEAAKAGVQRAHYRYIEAHIRTMCDM